MADPTSTDPDKYKVIFENERVRVLEYRDDPGEATRPHEHPDSLMYTLSSFDRRLVAESGESPTHVLFVELKEQRAAPAEGFSPTLGPT